MNKEMSPQRRKVVVLAASVACMSAVTPMLMRNHHTLGLLWLGLMFVALVLVIVEFGKLSKESR